MDRRRLNRVSALILGLGLGSAVLVFLLAEPETENSVLHDPRGEKKFHRELRIIGGQANVLSAEIQAWYDGLWQGRALAGTIAVLTVGATLAFRFAATFPPPPAPPKAGDAAPPVGKDQ